MKSPKLLKHFRQEPPDPNAVFELELEQSLRELCGGDEELYNALEHFLLFNPDMIVSNMGNIPFWLARAESGKSQGNNTMAAVSFETAARIAGYENDKETARKALTEAQRLNPNTEDAKLDGILLSKLDKVFEIASAHYSKMQGKKDREVATPLGSA